MNLQDTHPLTRADGSATFTDSLFTILAAANGPMEVSRRDELPEEAAIEVNLIRSSAGSPRDRWLEDVLTSLLRTLLLVHLHPRTLMQVTLQVIKEPGLDLKQGVMDIAIVPALANAAFAALVDGGLPLQRTMVATLGLVSEDGAVVAGPTEKEVRLCRSAHAMAWSMSGELLLAESVGRFDLEEWEDVAGQTKEVALAAMASTDGDAPMEGGGVSLREPWLRQKLEQDVREAGAWRNNV